MAKPGYPWVTIGRPIKGVVGTYSAIMVTNLRAAGVGSHYLTENWVGVLGIVASLLTTTASILAGALQ